MIRYFGRGPFLALLVVLQLAVLFPFRFTNELGERDSYRMFVGLADTLRTGTFFNSSLLYNRQASFGYYGLLYSLAPLAHTLSALIQTMNIISLVSVVLFLIPNYLVTEQLFGSWIAAVSGLLLIATPVWWNMGLYAHPITPALLLFFTGLALIRTYSAMPSLSIRAAALAFFAAALMFRFDVTLLFLVLFAMLWQVRNLPLLAVIKEAAFYILGSVALFAMVQHFLPPVIQGSAPPSVLELLARFQTPADIPRGIRDSIISLGQGFTPILLLAVPVSLWILLRKKQYPLLLFVSGEIIVNLIFWLPNTFPPRHYILIAPAIAISTAIAIAAFFPEPRRAGFAACATALLVIVTSISLNLGRNYLSYFPSQFTARLAMEKRISQADRIANGLLRLPSLTTPVIVLCDSNLVLAEMDKLSPDTSAIFKVLPVGSLLVGLHDVRQGGHRFIMVEQSWNKEEVQGFDKSGQYPGFPVLSAPFLSIPYAGRRPVVAAPK